ncbi:MAG: Mur ligase family protein, partial [Planctomycetota bacterium]
MEVLESRRLTGPNLVSDQPGAVLQVAADERAIELWRSRARAMLDAVGWHDERIGVRTFRGGADLFVSAPIDALYAACELNEWAATQTPLEEAARRIAEVIEQERNPKLLALRDAATTHDVCFLWDDDFVSAGMGEGSLVWATDDLPSAEEVDWNVVHDVPTVLVTGTNGKSTTVRLVASIVKAAGRTPGFCTTDYIRIGDQTLDEGDWTGPGATRKVLRHSRTQVAILEVARGGLLRRGLGVERADAAAILNVSADHLGEFGVDDVATLVTTKFLVARAARRLVLNADDEGVRARGHEVEMPVTWFSLSPEVEGCVLADGMLTLFGQAVAPVE